MPVTFIKDIAFKSTAVLLAACLLLSGCANTGVLRNTYGDTSDPCYFAREPLIASEEHFSQSIVTGAVTGAIIGIIGGAVLGGSDRDILLGAVGGALTGAAAGYIQAKQRQASDQAGLRRAINQDVLGDSRQVGQLGHALRSLNICRANQVAQIRAGIESGTLPAEEARQRLAMIRNAMAADNQLVAEVLQDVNERNAVYVQSLAAVEQRTEQQIRGAAERYQPRIVQATPLESRGSVNVRSQPDTRSQVVASLGPGQQIATFGKTADGQWYQVQTGAIQGYVYHNLLQRPGSGKIKKAAAVPVVAKESRPKAETEVEELLMETKEVDAEYQQQVSNLEQDMDDLEVMLI